MSISKKLKEDGVWQIAQILYTFVAHIKEVIRKELDSL